MEKQSELVRLAFVGVLVWAALRYLRGSSVAYNVGDISSRFELNPLTGPGDFKPYASGPLTPLPPPRPDYSGGSSSTTGASSGAPTTSYQPQ